VTHPSHLIRPPERTHRSAYLPDAAATERLGGQLAEHLVPGMRVYLRGELGTGKTCLIRGMLRRLGAAGAIKSPTYTLVELYVLSRLDLYHFDFYRFTDPNEFEEAGFPDHFHGEGVCLVEWPERAGEALPPPDLELSLAYSGAGRKIDARAYSETGERCLKGFSE
jgi:tRNA threonylcarbamoyladenosine biosynthesis protein TsaE